MNDVIVINHLQKNFGDKHVLKDVNCTVREGEIFGLLGVSGTGKTTIINILTGQMKKTGGEALVFGRNSEKLVDEDYANIGMTLEHIGLFERLSCYQNLSVFADIFKVDKCRIQDTLNKVNLSLESKTRAGRLSTGMRKRLALARAILHKPKLLFLDEPTSGLDPSNVRDIQQLILALRDEGVTIFLTTHKMDEAAKLCDYIAVLHHGVIAEYGTPSDICRKYTTQNTIKIVLKDGRTVILDNEPESEKCMASLMKNGEIITIHSMEPNLEEVFLSIIKEEQI